MAALLECAHATMEKHRYITRYNGQKGTRNTFCGWRLCITRQKEVYVRYFTDKEYGDEVRSLAAAVEVRDAMLSELESGQSFVEIIARYKKKR